jgi:hypothetical protein
MRSKRSIGAVRPTLTRLLEGGAYWRAVWLCLRFTLGPADLEEMLARRGIDAS